MKKFLVYPDGTRYELAPITEEEYRHSDLWTGGSDIAYNAMCRRNGWHNIDSFDLWDEGRNARVVFEEVPEGLNLKYDPEVD